MNKFSTWILGHQEISLSTQERATHTYVIGQSGTGKSRAMESWIQQDIIAGHGVGVIDPHGELYDHLLAWLATKPQYWEKVILFNPIDPDWIVGFNPLEKINTTSAERLALYMTDVSIKIWGLDATLAPRLVWLLTNTFLALVDLELSLLELPRFLQDPIFREALLEKLSLLDVKRFFIEEFPQSNKGQQQWIAPVLNKFGRLLFDPDIKQLFGNKTTINFQEIMDQEKILLVNVSKGVLGEGMSALVASFVVAHLQQSALAREVKRMRPPFYLYLDEFQNYTTDNIIDILSESRKYALSLTLAHQFLAQLPTKTQQAVLNTAGTIACFRVGYHDAKLLAKEIFPTPDFKYRIKVPLSARLPKVEQIGWEGLALELSNLRHREFWTRKRGRADPLKQTSFYMPTPPVTPEIHKKITALRNFSGKTYAHPKVRLQTSTKTDTTIHTILEDNPYWTI